MRINLNIPSFCKRQVNILGLLALLILPFPASAATVILNLLNTEPLVDSGLVPLLGNSSSGDLVQLYTLGGDNLVDIPHPNDGSLVDDVLFGSLNNPTHVGAGTIGPGNDSGLLVQVNIEFDDSLVGSEVYVRFWNAGTIQDATGYGQTGTLIIPALVFGEATLDFAPTGTGPYITSNGFFFGSTPEPSTATLFLSAGLVFLCRTNFRKWAVYAHHEIPSNRTAVKG